MPDKVDVPIAGKVDKKVLIVGGVVVVALGYYFYKKQQAASQSAAAAQTTAADTTTAAQSDTNIDPQTGYPYGSPEDQAALASLSYGILPTDTGYGGVGYPYPGSTGTGISGPGGYTNNAQWAQAAEASLGSDGNDAIAAALGKYLTGQDVTSDQQTIIQEAIAVQGTPPVPGPSGFPPSIHTSTPTPPTPTGNVTVPNVVGKGLDAAHTDLQKAGLTFNTKISSQGKPGQERKVIAQNPRAGSSVKKGTYVSLTYHWVKI